ncbi:hypothetical protein CPB86DRAFT_512912 [Serendipita vermifera]|nr:hypothetical protein CPB86DRAFT_512912 [Serendipita vermifera]
MVHSQVADSGSPSLAPPNPSFEPHPAFSVHNGDIVLQSSDFVLFGVHRCILSFSSAVFHDMFLLPSPSPPASVTNTKSRKEPILLTESAIILDALLQLVYPMPPPIFDDLSQLVPVLSACIKYEMSAALRVVRQYLLSTSFLLREPVRVFAIACRFGLLEEASEASRATLRINLLEIPPCDELRYVSAYDYHRLLALHQSRGQAARGLLSIRSRNCPLCCAGCSPTGAGRYDYPPRWWMEFERRAKEELRRRPLTDVIFSMRFLSECAKAGCASCGTSILESFIFMEDLKKEMDALPDALPFSSDH